MRRSVAVEFSRFVGGGWGSPSAERALQWKSGGDDSTEERVASVAGRYRRRGSNNSISYRRLRRSAMEEGLAEVAIFVSPAAKLPGCWKEGVLDGTAGQVPEGGEEDIAQRSRLSGGLAPSPPFSARGPPAAGAQRCMSTCGRRRCCYHVEVDGTSTRPHSRRPPPVQQRPLCTLTGQEATI